MSAPLYPASDEKDVVSHDEAPLSESSVPEDASLSTNGVAAKKLLWKIDLNIIPPLFILFLLAFMDRVNMGNARLQGLEAELGMKGSDYNIALFVFFIPYILFEVPSNLIVRRVAPSTYLCALMFLWGVVTIDQGLIRNLGGLVAMGALLGFLEAGFFPGCAYLMSMYYTRHQFQLRLSIFFSASIVAGAFGGLLAFAIASMSGVAGYSGWRWIFIIEGLLTCALAVACKLWVVDWPETSKFLTTQERRSVLSKVEADIGHVKMDKLNWAASKRMCGDWKIWCGTGMWLGVSTSGYAVQFFIPTIIKELGYTSAASQVRSVPIFVSAAVLSVAVGWLAHCLRHRYSFIMIGVLIATPGYIILMIHDNIPVGARYMACFLVTCGGFMAQPVTLVWLSNNVAGHVKRSVAPAMQIGLGNLGGIVASNVYLSNQAPKYPLGYGVSLGLLLFSALVATGFLFGLRYENKRRERGDRDWRLELPEEEVNNLGDAHPGFRFSL